MRLPNRSLLPGLAMVALMTTARPAAAQDNYEIQVYPSETMPAGVTMFELHSNFTVNGSRQFSDFGEFPTNHAIHETLEITHGFNDWAEIGFYVFTAIPQGQGWQWVGDHIRPRFRVPPSWNWPFGFSISQEFGYARAKFAGDTWTYELRPIVDKQMGRWYVAFNPALEKSLRGPTSSQTFGFAPAVNIGYDVTEKINLAVEYYGGTGTINRIFPAEQQEDDIYPAINLDLGPAWEFNFGYGFALTNGSDKHVLKMILGRRIGP